VHGEGTVLKNWKGIFFKLNKLAKLHVKFLLAVKSFKKAPAFVNQDSSGL
jgi:hypothetical protein